MEKSQKLPGTNVPLYKNPAYSTVHNSPVYSTVRHMWGGAHRTIGGNSMRLWHEWSKVNVKIFLFCLKENNIFYKKIYKFL